MEFKKSEEISINIGYTEPLRPTSGTAHWILGLKTYNLTGFVQFMVYCCGVFFFFLLYGYYQVMKY